MGNTYNFITELMFEEIYRKARVPSA